MPAYIHSAEAITPQPTFRTDAWMSATIRPEKGYFTCLHPDYRQLINLTSLRRMSPVIRMGLAASRICMEKAGITRPDAILTGSGLGCVRDTVRFLNQIIENDEQLLNPTAFIQSTHNTVSGQIALLLACKAHNLTFSQKTLSFESALLEALLLLREDPGQNILVGGIDEITGESYELLLQAGCARKEQAGRDPGPEPERDTGAQTESGPESQTETEPEHNPFTLAEPEVPGYIPGEGASFFALSGTFRKESLARIEDLEILPRPGTPEEPVLRLDAFLDRNGLERTDIGLLVSGRNGDARYSGSFARVEELFPDAELAAYKHLVGEYDTASAFGTWLAARGLHEGKLPETACIRRGSKGGMQHALVHNCSKGRDHSFILLSTPKP